MKNVIVITLLVAIAWYLFNKPAQAKKILAATEPQPQPENKSETTPTLAEVKQAIDDYFSSNPGMLDYISMQIGRSDASGLNNAIEKFFNQFNGSFDREHIQSIIMARVAAINQTPTGSNRLRNRRRNKLIYTGLTPAEKIQF